MLGSLSLFELIVVDVRVRLGMLSLRAVTGHHR
jgi:hypothetical protein